MCEKGLLRILLALTCLLVLGLLVVSAEHATADDRSGISGVQPPYYGDWYIDRDTNVTGQTLNLTKNVYVIEKINLVIKDSTINILYSSPNQYIFRVDTAAVVTIINSTLHLDSFQAIGQAALTVQNGSHIRTTGRFIGACSAVFGYDSTFVNIAPNGAQNQPGEDAIFILDGRVNAEMYRCRITNQAGNAGGTDPGVGGGDGGMASFISNVSLWSDCVIENFAGTSNGGGLGLTGTSGGAGGLGGDSEFVLQTNYLERTIITVNGSAGGNGARGADNTNGNAGDGGDGAQGGMARVGIASPSTLEIYGCDLYVKSGDGGSGGNGGTAYNGDAGTAGLGAGAGTSTLEITSVDDITIQDSTFNCIGGDGGYGGDYGRHDGGIGRNGVPKPGGDGGPATLTVDGNVNIFMERIKFSVRGGTGLDGGSGYDQGETGGNGAMAEMRVRAEASTEAKDIVLASYGGNGGNGGPAFSNIFGNGGDGGDSKLEYSGLMEMTVERFAMSIFEGKGGKGNTPAWNGAPGIPTFHVYTLKLKMTDGALDQPLADLGDGAEANLFNVSFREGMIPVLPLGDAQAWAWFPVDIKVVDSHDLSKAHPLKDYEVDIIQISTGATIAILKTDEEGLVSTYLIAFHYTSTASEYVGGYLVMAVSPDGKTSNKVRLDVQGPILMPEPFYVVVQGNKNAPDITVESPEPEKSYSFSDTSRVLNAFGFVTDKDESLITNMYVRLFPEADDSVNWPRVKLTLSPQILSEVKDESAKWGKYFQPEKNQNKWRYFCNFTIIGGDVLYKSGAYICEVTAYDGANTGVNRTKLDIKIVPKPPPPGPRPWATASPRVEALSLAEFNGSLMNLEELNGIGIEVKYYAWDFNGDGVLDYFSAKDGATFFIYDQVKQDTPITTTFTVVDSLGRQVNVTKEITVFRHVTQPPTTYERLITYMPIIIGVFLVALIVVGGLSIRAGRIRRVKEDEERKRVEEALANIHECPRCGALLDSKFATCNKCKTEDMLLEAQELIAGLKEKGIVALEQEDLLEKALISFEGTDYDTAQMFIKQASDQARTNTKRHEDTVKELAKIENLIRDLSAKGVVIPDVEMRVYHSKLALTRSDFKGAKEIADTLMADVTRLDAESRKDDIFEAIQKAERDVRTAKALGEKDTVPAGRAVEAAKAEFGGQDYVLAETRVREVYKLLEDPTWTPEREREAAEEKAKREAALKTTVEETQRIMEEEHRRQEELKKVSVATTGEVKIKTFEEEKKPKEARVIVPEKGKVVEHVMAKERVVEVVTPPPMPAMVLEPKVSIPEPEEEEGVAEEGEEGEEAEEEEAEEEKELPQSPRPVPTMSPIAARREPKPVEAPRPAPTPAPRPAPTPVAAKPVPRPVARPVARPEPVGARPVPKPAEAPKPVPKPMPKPVAPAPVPATKRVPAGEATKETTAAEKVPCKKCGRDIKVTWKKCPFCGTQQ